MASTQRTGLPALLQQLGDRRGPPVGLVDGPVDTSHPALARHRVRAVDRGDPSCTNRSSPACHHGTFVAGQLARLVPQSELLTHALFCEADSLDACPVLGPPDLARAIDRLIDAGARVINLSVGQQGRAAGSMTPLRAAYQRAREQGVLLVAAAGNESAYDANPLFRDPWVISVAAQDGAGTILPTSNRGGAVARSGLLAPGDELLGVAAGGGTTRMSGTSVAAPWVTAAAALLWSLHPEATAEQIRRALLLPDVAREADVPPSLDSLASHRWLSHQLRTTRSLPERSPMPHNTTFDDVNPRVSARSGRGQAAAGAGTRGSIAPQSCGCGGGTPAGFVYSTGQLAIRFPDEGDRQEYDGVARQQNLPPDQYAKVLGANRYLARRVCWVLQLESRPVGILVPRGEAELTDLITALGMQENDPDLRVVITGTLGSTAPASRCDGLQVPMVAVTEVQYFAEADLIALIEKDIGKVDASTVIYPIWRSTGVWRQPGFDDSQRALNYVALRTTALYLELQQLSAANPSWWLTTITANVGQSETGRTVVDVDATFQTRTTQTQTWRTQVDVTDLFPFQSQALFQV